MMVISSIKCPKCGKRITKKVLKITHGRCNNCNFLLVESLAKFTSARERIKSKYNK
ncbi:MAG: hypothetical protein QXD43_01380 [Candidatus Aenigmatarchaeota archaeon]